MEYKPKKDTMKNSEKNISNPNELGPEWEAIFDKYTFKGIIGKGSFGQVVEAMDPSSSQ